MRRRVRDLSAVFASLGLIAPGLASQVAVTGSLFTGVAEHRVDGGYGVERSSGALLGSAASLLVFRRLELAVRAEGGTLGAASSGAVDRDMAEVDVRLRGRAAPWLILEVGYARRMYSAVLARQAWTMLGAGVEGRVALLEGAIHGVARAELLPAVSVSGLPGPDLAFTSAAGVEYSHGALGASAFYSLERYDFPTVNAVQRLEQLTAFTLRFDVRLLPR